MSALRLALLSFAIAAATAATSLGGCGEIARYTDAGPDDPPPPDDGGVVADAPPTTPDAGVPPDASPPPPPPPPGTARELAVTAGRVSYYRFVLDLEITGGVAARPASGGAFTLAPSTTVTLPAGGN